MLTVKVGNQWLSTVGPYGPVTVEFGEHGSEAAAWSMNQSTRHPLLRGNQAVQVWDSGFCIWVGRLNEPGGDGEYTARGIWHEAERAPAITTAGVLTTVPDTAISAANTLGNISWGYSSSISATAWSTANGELSLAQLLDGVAAESGLRWVVAPNYVVSMVAEPTTPKWYVPHAVAGRGLTPAEDEFASHLIGTYMSGAGTYATETVGSADAAAAFGRRTVPVDLTDMGIITQARANAVLTGMFVRAGARMGWAEGLELSHGQLTNAGGVPAALAQVQSWQMVRLAGTVDTSRPNLLRGNTDIAIRSSRYTDGSKTILLEPVGYAARTLGDVLDPEDE